MHSSVASSSLGRNFLRVVKVRPYSVSFNLAEKDRLEKLEHGRSCYDIPGPKGLPLIGNVFRFLPYIGEYADKPLLTQLQMLRDSYGKIVKLEGILNRRPTVFLFAPELCERMYRLQGRWPMRVAMETLRYYRLNRDRIFEGECGLTTSQGKKWHDFRSKVNRHLMRPRAVEPHLDQISQIADEFVLRMREMRDPETLELPPSFNNELSKWSLESICSVALDHRPGCLRANLPADSEPQTMIDCIHEMFELMYRLELRPSFWKLFETSDLVAMFRVLDRFNGIAVGYVNRAREGLRGKREDGSILERLLSVDELVARIMALDMLTAGVDTTSNASGALLYYLATNPEKQERLREEIRKGFPRGSGLVSFDALNHLPYLKACVKESLRLFPISIGSLRTMQSNVCLGGYEVPAGWDVIACHAVLAVDPAQFSRANEFIPERWLRRVPPDFPSAKEAHPFAYMPFGFGTRSCVGRRFAEMEMEVLLLKVIENFAIEWHHEPLEYDSRFINVVSSPLRLKLLDL